MTVRSSQLTLSTLVGRVATSDEAGMNLSSRVAVVRHQGRTECADNARFLASMSTNGNETHAQLYG